MNHRIVTALIVALGLAGLAAESAAQTADPTRTARYLDDRWSFRLFGNVSDLSSDVSAGHELGALINLEDLLGFDDQMTTWGFDGFFRVSKNRKHAIRVSYSDFTRDAYAALSGTVPILDVEFLGEVSSRFENRVGTLGYQYSFINNGKIEAGVTAGFGIYKYGIRLSGRYILDNDPTQEDFGSRKEDILAPVPTVGFFINYALTPKLILDMRTSAIDLAIGVHEGRIFNNCVNLNWYFSRHFGLGIGLAGSDVVYENTGGDSRIKVDLRQTSFTANASLVF